MFAALRSLEERTRQADVLVLRVGELYGPGTIYGARGSFVCEVRAGKMPIIGTGDGIFSFNHVHDAATAIVAALHSDARGVLNIVDDEPAPVREWLPSSPNCQALRHRSTCPWLLPNWSAVARGWLS
ncbi:NAD-dependent epimerase/dehydratase family protein [Kribbella sp. NBC_00889]|uniref:NAD-dependent epimerase/dehydratase family protein n=1 Tax=Kribbella sp. NBC_00889 TaxID=2975974 RepID=UPI00386B3199|nr:NAD-dependent epimerase/dehydratase family protein [Kribbella sp. NBC_00889]